MQNKFYVFVLFLLLKASTSSAQLPADWQLSITVSDEYGVPISEASILLDDQLMLITGSNGNVFATMKTKPKVVAVRRIGYLTSRFALDTLQWQNRKAQLDIVLGSDNPVLREVVISSNPIQQIFEEDFSHELLDYSFMGSKLLLLVREKKQYYLRYTSTDASIVYSEMHLPNLGSQRIFASCTGGQHVVGTAGVWEVSLNRGNLDTFPRYEPWQFYRVIEPCQATLDGYYFFRKMLDLNQAVRYTYVGPDRKQRHLMTISDSLAGANAMAALDDFASGGEFFLPRPIDRGGSSFARPSSGGTGLSADDIPVSEPTSIANLMKYLNPDNNSQLYAFGVLQNALLDSVYAPMLLLKGRIYIFDHVNNRTLEVSGPELDLVPSPLTYHRANRWRDELIGDVSTGKIYGLFGRADAGHLLKEVDFATGKAVSEIPLGDIPYLSNRFKVRNGILYAIGQPDVNIPNKYLYRVVLEKLVERTIK